MFSITSTKIILVLAYGWLCICGIWFVTFVCTSCFTIARWRWDLYHHKPGTGKTTSPIKIPYAYPFLGSAAAFLNQKKGWFWARLFKQHPRSTAACTLLMGGKTMHVLYDSSAIQALFKARGPHRDRFTMDVLVKGFGIKYSDAVRALGYDEGPLQELGGRTPRVEVERQWNDYLLKASCVNELTHKFASCLQEQLGSEIHKGQRSTTVNLCGWIREQVFKASTVTLFGATALEDCPSLEEDFYTFDNTFMACYFGIPKWIAPKAYTIRDKITKDMVSWHEKNMSRTRGNVVDPDGSTAWEPIWGSRINRARQLFYQTRGLNTRTCALMDLGFLFGVSSNSVPAISWCLLHILNPQGDPTLHARVTTEINASKRTDGTLDIALLSNQPLLLSILYEVLRLYVDNLVTRELPDDLILPTGDPRTNDKILLRKDSIVVAPSWIQHRADDAWQTAATTTHGPPASEFHAERFLTTNPDTGEMVFSTAGTAGRLFPFGGGKTICPGRVFARQEILMGIAVVLDTFEIGVRGFVDGKGRRCDAFPGLADGYPGVSIMTVSGDMEVEISRKGL